MVTELEFHLEGVFVPCVLSDRGRDQSGLCQVHQCIEAEAHVGGKAVGDVAESLELLVGEIRIGSWLLRLPCRRYISPFYGFCRRTPSNRSFTILSDIYDLTESSMCFIYNNNFISNKDLPVA